MQNSTQKNKQRGIDLAIGIAVVAAALLLFGWLVWSVARSVHGSLVAEAAGEIVAEGQGVRGSEQVYTLVTQQPPAHGAEIVWSVDGEEAARSSYSGEAMTLHYTFSQSGRHTVEASVGRCRQALDVEIEPPLLTLAAPSVTIVYGEPLPELKPQASGFVGTEAQGFCCEDCLVECDALDVGVYRIVPRECSYADYKTETICGVLTVLPRRLSVSGGFVKVYDGTSVLENPELTIEGVCDGDDVSVQCDRLYLDGKNAGTRLAPLGSARLVGADAHNYALPELAEVTITRRALALTGTEVKSKLYDGTTKAEIAKMGVLEGVCEGDSVAIGTMETHFDGADVGVHRVKPENISLVGADKDNYLLARVEGCEAQILQNSFWHKLLNKQNIATKSK